MILLEMLHDNKILLLIKKETDKMSYNYESAKNK